MAFDPDEFLNDKKPRAGAGGFDPDAFLAGPSAVGGAEPAMVADIPMPSMMAEPKALPQLPVSGYGPGIGSQLAQTQLGQMGQNVGRVMQPYATAASKVAGQYVANPLTKLAPDLAAAVHGIPPPYATSQAIGATQGAYNVGRQIAQGTKIPGAPVAPVAPAPTPAQIAGNPMLSEMAARNAAMQSESMATRSLMQKIAASKVMQMAAPVLNTAARVAGPAGMAYNMYEAGQMTREAQLGQRLAQGQGRDAEKSFRDLNVRYGNVFQNSLTPQQAQDILASNSARDIESFGGAAQLRRRAAGQ